MKTARPSPGRHTFPRCSPSDYHRGLQLRRGSASVPFLKFIPHEVQSPICVGVCVCVCVWGGAFEKVQVSATKFKYRKNLRGGRIPARPCLLDGPKTAPRPLLPAHFWRMAICDSPRVGGPLSPKPPRAPSANKSGRLCGNWAIAREGATRHIPFGVGKPMRSTTPALTSLQL